MSDPDLSLDLDLDLEQEGWCLMLTLSVEAVIFLLADSCSVPWMRKIGIAAKEHWCLEELMVIPCHRREKVAPT
jgi:hypothetical protein